MRPRPAAEREFARTFLARRWALRENSGILAHSIRNTSQRRRAAGEARAPFTHNVLCSGATRNRPSRFVPSKFRGRGVADRVHFRLRLRWNAGFKSPITLSKVRRLVISSENRISEWDPMSCCG